MLKTDVVVIGAGAVGCAVARELSKYDVDVIVVEKNEDVGGDASKSNSAIIHTGYDAAPGTLESQLVVTANRNQGKGLPQPRLRCGDEDRQTASGDGAQPESRREGRSVHPP